MSLHLCLSSVAMDLFTVLYFETNWQSVELKLKWDLSVHRNLRSYLNFSLSIPGHPGSDLHPEHHQQCYKGEKATQCIMERQEFF